MSAGLGVIATQAQTDTVGYRRVDVYLRRSLKESNSATYS